MVVVFNGNQATVDIQFVFLPMESIHTVAWEMFLHSVCCHGNLMSNYVNSKILKLIVNANYTSIICVGFGDYNTK